MAVKFAAWGNAQFVIPSTGAPASGYLLYTYVAGSATPVTTYTTSAGNVAQSNPIVLNSAGFPTTGQIWITEGTSIKIVFTDPSDVVIKTEDNIPGTNDASITQDQWVASGLTPTYVSATSFTLVGDQTTAFHVGRRLKTTNSGGTVYSTITESTFGAVTTVTVVNDSGTLDSGLSAVSYGLLTATNPSTPLLADDYPIVSGSADKTKKVRLEVDGITTNTTRVLTVPDRDLTIASAPVVATSQATTSGTAWDFTGIPSWVTQITVTIAGLSFANTVDLVIQIGDSGGPETSGYLGTTSGLAAASVATVNSTAGFGTCAMVAASVAHGSLVITLVDAASFTWAASGAIGFSNATQTYVIAGAKSLSAALDRVRITTVAGSVAGDAGLVNIRYS